MNIHHSNHPLGLHVPAESGIRAEETWVILSNAWPPGLSVRCQILGR